MLVPEDLDHLSLMEIANKEGHAKASLPGAS